MILKDHPVFSEAKKLFFWRLCERGVS